MPFYIDENETELLVECLARYRGVTKQDPVKLAIIAALEESGKIESLRVRLQRIRTEFPLPPLTGLPALCLL
jgi:hypothetical protein